MNKLLIAVGILCWSVVTGLAQVTVEVTLTQSEFLPSEALPAAVKITNRSGQRLHLGDDPNWLTFDVESDDGFTVIKKAEVPVVGPFDLESSQMAIKRVDLAPYFILNQAGRYHIVATLRIKDWAAQEPSEPKLFDVVNGVTIWTQDFGVPGTAAGHAPETRRYSLIKVNYLLSQLRLYVQVSDPTDAQVYKVQAVGRMVSFSQPEEEVDEASNLHVLYQSGATLFSYTVIDPSGAIVSRDYYDYVSTRPRLSVNEQGQVVVIGGVRRPAPGELPQVKMPAEVQIPAHH